MSELRGLMPVPEVESADRLGWKTFSKALLNATRNGVYVVDKTGTVVISNELIQKTFGLFPGSLLKATLPEFWPHVEEVLNGRHYRAGIPIHAPNASFLARVSPILWRGGLIGVLCIFDDHTELDKTTRRMLSFKALSKELDAIIDSSNDGLWICDADARVVRINAASERINNVRAEEVVGRSMRELVTEGFVDRSVTLEVIETRSKVNMLQQTRQGRKLMLTGNPVFDEDGKLIRIVVNERDITEIDTLRQELEEQAAIRDQFRHQILEMQLAELESNRIIARSHSFANVLQQALKVSRVDSTVLILGESGTGKGVIADLIHKYSSRARQPMIKINCGAIPESLVETELFGYETGAYTGAGRKGKPGQFELADKGILFLDEIAELPLSSQVKLLRFLEDGQVSRVGGTVNRRLDVRVLCATNQDLDGMVERGRFRRDLFYRLNVIPIRVPPLRERRDCILPLIQHYWGRFNAKMKRKKPLRLTQRASEALLAYAYPGNVRELINLCERLAVMSESEQIDLEDLPGSVATSGEIICDPDEGLTEGLSLQDIVARVEQRVLARALAQHGTQAQVAAALKINQSTVARKLKKHGIV